MKRLAVAAMFVVCAGFVGTVHADDKANPTGTWKWKAGTGNRAREVTLKLKLDGDKLTGSVVGRNNDTPIEDAKFKDGEVSFKVTREGKGGKTTTSYSGKVSGDTIKGKVESERGGKTQSRDWEAKREKE
jgi:hypothetical protein